MRIAYLIAGAGGMYCGSCLRDNRLAAALLGRGIDVAAIPLYTPLRTDEDSVARHPVHFGGISLYLAHKSAAFRRMPAWLQRLLDAPALLQWASRRRLRTDAKQLAGLTLAMLRGDSPVHARHRADLDAHLRRLDPDVVHLPNLLFIGLAAGLRRCGRGGIVCTLAGEDVFLDALPQPQRGAAEELIRAGAASVDAFIAPTRYYAQAAVERFGVPAARVHYVPMGVPPSGGVAAPPEAPFVIGYLARVAPEKGLAQLAEAFTALCAQGRDCVLRVAGYLPAEHTAYLEQVRQRIAAAGWGDRFHYAGELDAAAKDRFLQGLHCLSVPAIHPEPKGLYVLEALARGVPVVLPRTGSFPELVQDTGGGVLYEPGNADALAAALAELMDAPEVRAGLGRSGRAAVAARYSTDAMADAAVRLFERMTASLPVQD